MYFSCCFVLRHSFELDYGSTYINIYTGCPNKRLYEDFWYNYMLYSITFIIILNTLSIEPLLEFSSITPAPDFNIPHILGYMPTCIQHVQWVVYNIPFSLFVLRNSSRSLQFLSECWFYLFMMSVKWPRLYNLLIQ